MIYFEAIIQLFSLIWSFYFRYTWEILVGGGGGLNSSRAAGSAVLVEVGSFVGVSSIFLILFIV